MEQQTFPIGKTENQQEIDPAIFSTQEPLVDKWKGEYGFRLYRFDTDIPHIPPVFVGTTYTREIDVGTGEPTEETRIETVGHISVDINITPTEIADHFYDIEPMEPRGIHEMLPRIEEEIETRLNEAEVTEIQSDAFGELYVTAGADSFNEMLTLINEKYDTEKEFDWNLFLDDGLNSMSSVVYTFPSTVSITNDGRDVFDGKPYYSPNVQFEPVSDWVLRYIENRYCGHFPSSRMAAVEAMVSDETIETQAEMAEILDVTDGSVSQIISGLEDFREELNWMCQNKAMN